VVSGPLGGAAAGLAELEAGRRPAPELLAAFLYPEPRIGQGRALAAAGAHAMIDLSDGIATDAGRLAAASGTGAVVELDRLPRAPGATVEQAAAGGEDYELLAAVPDGAELPVPVTAVGRLTGDAAVRLLDAKGRERSLRGWDHFA